LSAGKAPSKSSENRVEELNKPTSDFLSVCVPLSSPELDRLLRSAEHSVTIRSKISIIPDSAFFFNTVPCPLSIKLYATPGFMIYGTYI
jgi:hypothetical protein